MTYGSEQDPYSGTERCQRTRDRDEHPEHVWAAPNGAQREAWWKCHGYETTHRVVVLRANGTEILNQPVMLRDSDPKWGPSDLDLWFRLDENKHVPEHEREALAAVHLVAPDLCPYDSERCREHLVEMMEDDE